MQNPTRLQLKWVHRNRTERCREALLGPLSQGLVDRELKRQVQATTPKRIAEAVATSPDELLRAHCRIQGTRGDVLTMEVDDPRFLGIVRMQCAAPLLSHVNEVVGGNRIRAVRFQVMLGVPWRNGRSPIATAD